MCDNVRERVVDPTSDLLVCPVSGRTAERMMTEWEENDLLENRNEEQFEEFTGMMSYSLVHYFLNSRIGMPL